MKYFLLILGITIVGFGDSFKVMSNANAEVNEFLSPNGFFGGVFYSYLIGMG